MPLRQWWTFLLGISEAPLSWKQLGLSGMASLLLSGCGGGGVLGAYATGQGYLRVRSEKRCPTLQIFYQTQNYGALPPEGTLDLGKISSSGILNVCETTKTAPAVNQCVSFPVTLNIASASEATLTCLSSDPLNVHITME